MYVSDSSVWDDAYHEYICSSSISAYFKNWVIQFILNA